MSVHGTARFALRDEVRQAGLVCGRQPGEFPDGLMVGWWIAGTDDFEPIEYAGDLHQLIVGGTGGGKFTTALGPLLLGSQLEERTVVVVDPKGEIANLVGPCFEKPFHPTRSIHLLDPWDQCGTGQCATLNVLEQITTDNPNYVDDARALADAMIIPSGGENTHWDNAARNFLTAILLYVALSPKEAGNRDLIRVRDLVSMTWAMPKAYTGPKRPTLSAILFELIESDLAGGAVKRGISSLFNREDKERSGIISSIDRDTSWIDSPQMQKVLRGTSLDMKQAATGGHKYFIVLPPDFFMTHRAWLRLMVTAFAKAFKRNRPAARGPQHTRWRHIVIDEFANLGEMSFILNDIAVSRGFEVKYHLSIQDLSQLARVYDKGWESFINNSFQRFFAISDLFTADYVSRMLGASTVQSISDSQGVTGGTSHSTSFGDSVSQGRSSSTVGFGGSTSSGTGQNYSTSSSENNGWTRGQSSSQVQRPLQTADEVRRMPVNAQFLFFRGLHPIECWRPPYWTIFPSLPKYSLKEILGTIGRQPKNRSELQYFTGWREHAQLMVPKPRAKALPAPDQPVSQTIALPAPESRRYGTKVTIGIAALLLVYWVWPASSPPRPAPVPEPPAPRVAVAPPISPPAPARPVHVRPKVPNPQAADGMPRGANTRDYFVNLIRTQLMECTTGRGKQERELIANLVYWATVKAELVQGQGAVRVPQSRKYSALFDENLKRSSWSVTERQYMLGLIARVLQENYNTEAAISKAVDASLDRFYAGGGCPFAPLPEADYRPPEFADAKTLFSKQ